MRKITELIEAVRSMTGQGSVTVGKIEQNIQKVMQRTDIGWQEKIDLLDLVETRAINGLENFNDVRAVQREIAAKSEQLLREGGRL